MMIGILVRKDGKTYPVVSFTAPDTLILKGDLMEFETSLRKSVLNGYTLQESQDKKLQEMAEALYKELP